MGVRLDFNYEDDYFVHVCIVVELTFSPPPLCKPQIRSINQFPLVLFLPCVYTRDCLGDIGHISISGPIHKSIYS